MTAEQERALTLVDCKEIYCGNCILAPIGFCGMSVAERLTVEFTQEMQDFIEQNKKFDTDWDKAKAEFIYNVLRNKEDNQRD